MLIDQTLVWQATEEGARLVDDPRARHMLEVLTEHSKAEVDGDLERVMATLVTDPEYHFWLDGRDSGPKGRTQVTAFYESLLGSGAGLVEAPKVRVVAGQDCVATESVVRHVMPGNVAGDNGYLVDNRDGYYLVWYRMVVFWPFSTDGLLVGEDFFLNRNMTDIRALGEEEVSEAVEQLGLLTALRPNWVMADKSW